MQVTLVDYTGAGSYDPSTYAAARLIFAKSTRLNLSPSLLREIEDRSWIDILDELEYIANTIPSSWEFVDYTFLIEGVSRGFTHQLVRTRHASFAQQTMRVLKMEEWKYHTGPSLMDPKRFEIYDRTMKEIAVGYDVLVDMGAEVEDARGVLPTAIHTNILMKCNLRTFVETVRKRTSPRVQGEYREFLQLAVKAVHEVHPWIDLFLARTADKAAAELNEKIMGIAGMSKEERMNLIKLVDQVRQNG